MDENYDRNSKATGYLDRKEDEAEDRIIDGLVKIILFVTGCICGAVFF